MPSDSELCSPLDGFSSSVSLSLAFSGLAGVLYQDGFALGSPFKPPTMSGYYSTLNDLPTDDYCSRHDCHTRRDKDFLFWMYKLPLSLKHTFVSHTLSNLPEISRKRGNKFGVIHTLPSAIIPGMIARLVEQVSSNEHPLTLRRDAFLSLTIIVDLYVFIFTSWYIKSYFSRHSEVILAEDLLSTIFQGVLNVQYSTDIEEMDPLTLEDICSDLPVIVSPYFKCFYPI